MSKRGSPEFVYAKSRKEAQRLLDESYLEKFVAIPIEYADLLKSQFLTVQKLQAIIDVEVELSKAAYARIRELEICVCGHRRDRHDKGYCNIQYDPCDCKGKFVAQY